jgi:hypothetical protein
LKRSEEDAKQAEKSKRAVGPAARRAGAAALEEATSAGVVVGRLKEVGRAARLAFEERHAGKRLTYGPLGLGGGLSPGSAERDTKGRLAFEVRTASAAYKAMEAASWLARANVLRSGGQGDPAVDRMAEIYLPFLDAVEAGLWLYWITPDAVLAVAKPAPETEVQVPEGAAVADVGTPVHPYLSSLGATLEEEGFEDWSRLAGAVAAEGFWRRGEIQGIKDAKFEIFVAVRRSTPEETSQEELFAFSRAAAELSLQQKLSGPGSLALTYAALVAGSIPPELRQLLAKQAPPKHWAHAYEFPVVVDLSSGEVLRCEKKPLQQRLYLGDISRRAERLFSRG